MSLNLALQLNSLAHHAKGTPSAVAQVNLSHRPPTVCKLLVSGSISLPYKGFFSPFPRGTGSLSVINEYLALEGGPPRFGPDFTWPALLRCQSHLHQLFAYRAFTFFDGTFQCPSAKLCRLNVWSFNPIRISPVVWALPVSLAATMGISSRFLFLILLRCVTSDGLASVAYLFPHR